MATKLNGMITLSGIDKSQLRKLNNGDIVLYIDVVQRREPSKAGYTHYISYYNKVTKETEYIGNLKEVEIDGGREVSVDDDLPDFLKDI